MKRALQVIGLITCGCVTASAAADDFVTFGPGYVATLVGIAFPSKDIGTTGRGVTGSVIFGHEFSPHFLAEINLASSIFETGVGGGTDFYQNGGTADFVVQLRDRQKGLFTPFVLLGIGAVYEDFYPNTHDGAAPLAEIGVGLISAPLLHNGIRLRLDARYLRDFHESDHPERLVIFGVDIPLGRIEHRIEFREPRIIHEVIREPAPIAALVPAPVPDSDGDGVSDEHDTCPDTPRGLRVDASGCALARQAISLEGVNFGFNDAHLTPQAERILDSVVKAYRGQPSMKTEISGHTDSVGNDEANLKLSERRAKAVREYLIAKGVRSDQVVAHGYGKSHLRVDPERSDADGESNRRVELSILSQ